MTEAVLTINDMLARLDRRRIRNSKIRAVLDKIYRGLSFEKYGTLSCSWYGYQDQDGYVDSYNWDEDVEEEDEKSVW
jgi:hypothetical protein